MHGIDVSTVVDQGPPLTPGFEQIPSRDHLVDEKPQYPMSRDCSFVGNAPDEGANGCEQEMAIIVSKL
jgi:hypothetical protein